MATIRDRKLMRAMLFIVGLGLGMPALAQAGEEDGPAVEDTRVMLDKWLELRKAISKQKSDWALTKEIMQDQIELRKANIEELKAEIEAQREKLRGFDSGIAALEMEEEKLKQATERLEALVESMEARTLAIVKRTPEPLFDQIKPLAVQLPGYKRDQAAGSEDAGAAEKAAAAEGESPEGEEENKVPLSRRVENVVGVLYMINKYTGKVEQTRVSVQTDDGSSLSVDALYLGLSAGYYVNDDAASGGFGWGAPQGWGWQTFDQPEAAAQVKQAISVFNKDQPATYIGLPAEVKD